MRNRQCMKYFQYLVQPIKHYSLQMHISLLLLIGIQEDQSMMYSFGMRIHQPMKQLSFVLNSLLNLYIHRMRAFLSLL